MSNEFELSPANQELEMALGQLKPASPHLDRDRVMFRAGQASIQKNQLFWPVLSGALTLMLGFSWIIQLPSHSRSQAHSEVREARLNVAHVSNVAPVAKQPQWIASAAEIASGDVSGSAYLKLRNGVLQRGLDALPKDRAGHETGTVETWKSSQSAGAKSAELNL